MHDFYFLCYLGLDFTQCGQAFFDPELERQVRDLENKRSCQPVVGRYGRRCFAIVVSGIRDPPRPAGRDQINCKTNLKFDVKTHTVELISVNADVL